MNNTKIITSVFVCYEIEPDSYIKKIKKIGKKLSVEFKGVLIVNNTHHALAEDDKISSVRGTNKYRDVSGYIEGLKYLTENGLSSEDSPIFFSNDSLFTRHSAYGIISSLVLKIGFISELRIPVLAGKVDRYVTVCHQNPWNGMHFFVSTFAFMINSRAIKYLLSWENYAQDDEILNNINVESDEWGNTLPAVLREYFRAHLIYKYSPMLWQVANISNAKLLNHKAYNIHFEQRLSGMVGKHGSLIPINDSYIARAKLEIYEFIFRFFSKLFMSDLRKISIIKKKGEL